MTEPEKHLDLEVLLKDALRPIEPPERLAGRVETTLTAVTESAAAELSSWADELSESELESLRDPRNWVRPVAAVAVGGAAAAGLAVVVATRNRRRRDTTGLLAPVENALRELRRS
jgi:phosphotransferase system  glucose/maltose/N-acetylglucosamine-specific IIC component